MLGKDAGAQFAYIASVRIFNTPTLVGSRVLAGAGSGNGCAKHERGPATASLDRDPGTRRNRAPAEHAGIGPGAGLPQRH